MEIFLVEAYIFVIILGLLLGSFISAFSWRYHAKLNWWSDRSRCTFCNHILSWYDLFPLFSYLFLKGKCHYCNKHISIRYPFMELSVLASFLFLTLKFPIISSQFATYALLSFLLVLLSWYDISFREVIDVIAIPLIVILIILNIANLTTLILSLAVFILFCLIVIFTNGMGGGDIRIAVIASLVLGFPNFIVGFEIAVFLAVIYGVSSSFKKHKSIKDIKKTQVPMIPFFTIGILIALVYGDIIVKKFLNL